MADLPPARVLLAQAPATCHGHVVLDYDARLIRRKRLLTADGEGFLVDLPAVTNLDDWWGFQLEDGRSIRVDPAPEALVAVTGSALAPNLARLAWHIGNRHTPCQIAADRLLIRRDHVLEAMLTRLGAVLTHVTGPFTPEGGAYGHGRTMGHAHGDEDHTAVPAPAHTHERDGQFGWHSHGDGQAHFHAAPPAAAAPDPLLAAVAPLLHRQKATG